MTRLPLVKNRWGHAALVVAVLMTLAGSACALGGGHGTLDAHGITHDACVGMPAISVASLLSKPLQNGWSVVDPGPVVAVASIHLVDPPPKSALS